VGMP